MIYSGGGTLRAPAFTLAEVLVTLGIIGVVAAMTMPSLIANHQEKQTVSQLKKSYSTIQQAFLSARNEYGDIADWSDAGTRPQLSDEWFQKLKPYMNIVKYCGLSSGAPKDCMGSSYQTLNKNRTNMDLNDNGSTGVNFVLADGSSVRFVAYDKDCNHLDSDYCGNIYIDVNGAKKPNQIGRDYFYFAILPDRIIPGGSQVSGENIFQEQCNMEASYTSNGDGCSAWVLINENLDYLHCNDLNWNGKTSCK